MGYDDLVVQPYFEVARQVAQNIAVIGNITPKNEDFQAAFFGLESWLPQPQPPR